MALKIKSYIGEETALCGVYFNCRYFPPGETTCETVRNNDLLLPYLWQWLWIVPFRTSTVSELMGFVPPLGQRVSRDFVVSNPVYEERSYDSQYDDRVYGNLFRNFQVLDSVLSGRSYPIPSYQSEHQCHHINYSGLVIPEKDDLQGDVAGFDFWGYSIPVRFTGGNYIAGVNVLTVNPTTFSPLIYQIDGRFSHHFLDLVDGLIAIGDVVNWTVANGQLLERHINSFSYTHTETELAVTYHGSVQNHTQGDSWYWRSVVRVRFQPVSGNSIPSVGEYGSPYTEPTSYEFAMTSITLGGYSGPVGRLTDYQVGSPPYAAAPIVLTDTTPPAASEEDDLALAYSSLTNDIYLTHFANSIRSQFGEIVPSSAFSSVDAFLQAEDLLGVDTLQNIVKIPQLASAIPNIKEAVALLSDLVKLKLDTASLRRILDLSSSTILQANFQWAPYHRLLTEYLPQIVSTFQSVSSGKRVEGRGLFRHSATNILGRDNVSFSTRTKIVMDTSTSGLLSALIGVDSLGILPKPSNLWDLVPFSFVANWFTGIGQSIKRAEYSLLSAGIPAYFVHTYLITSPLTEDELEHLKVSSVGTVPASLRYFQRDVSLHSPCPRDSVFGFGLPTKFPPLGTLASLLYQQIF